jgi:hypothetical protein
MSDILLDINKLILTNRIKEINKKNGIVYIVDFDSGYLTDFLLEIKVKYHLNIVIDSFTTLNSNQETNHQNHTIFKRQLLTCSDSSYNNMFTRKKYEKIKMVKSQQNPEKNMYNTFFEIKPGDLKKHYDVAFITGPNSNGRDLAFLHLKDRMEEGGFILLNELDKFTSMEQMRLFFKTKVSFKNNVTIDRIGFFQITERR